MEISRLERPKTLDEAYGHIVERKAFPLGGGAWSRMSSKTVELAVDLSALDLRYIREKGEQIEIGAMATARDIETSVLLEKTFGPMLRKAVSHIVGVQMRNIVTVGGTVAGRYGFSDLNTALLALDATVVLYRGGERSLESFLSSSSATSADEHDGAADNLPILIEKIVIGTKSGHGAFQSVRNTTADLPILNVAAAYGKSGWRIAVGARPGSARSAKKAMAILGTNARPELAVIREAALAAAQEMSFGNDLRGTAEYRADVCPALVRRAIAEVAG